MLQHVGKHFLIDESWLKILIIIFQKNMATKWPTGNYKFHLTIQTESETESLQKSPIRTFFGDSFLANSLFTVFIGSDV